MEIEKRREALRKLEEAYSRYAYADVPRKEFDEHSRKTYEQEEKFLNEFFEETSKPTLEDIADAVSKAGIGMTIFGMDKITRNIPQEKSSDLRDGFSDYFNENKEKWNDLGLWMYPLDEGIDIAIRKCGYAFSRIGVKADMLPEIVLHDTAFLEKYLGALVPDYMLEEEGSWEYKKYMEYVDFIQDIQSKFEIKHKKGVLQEKETQLSSLEAEEQTISEAEALIGKQTEKEGQDIGEE